MPQRDFEIRFRVDPVTGRARAEIRELSGELGRAGDRVDRVGRSARAANAAMSSFGRAATAAASALSAFVGARAFLDVTAQAEALDKSFVAVTRSAAAAAAEMSFAETVADRYGLAIQDASEQLLSLTAASRGTNLEGQATRDIYESIVLAMAKLGRSSADTAGALTAVEQIISKGTVSAEELRGQLGERLPGAFQIAARAMGVTTEELGKMLEQGEITAEVMLPKLAAALQEAYDDGGAITTRTAETARFGNALRDLALELDETFKINEKLTDSVRDGTSAVRAITEGVRDLTPSIEAARIEWGNWLDVLSVSTPQILGAVGGMLRGLITDIDEVSARAQELTHNLARDLASLPDRFSAAVTVVGAKGAELASRFVPGLESAARALEQDALAAVKAAEANVAAREAKAALAREAALARNAAEDYAEAWAKVSTMTSSAADDTDTLSKSTDAATSSAEGAAVAADTFAKALGGGSGGSRRGGGVSRAATAAAESTRRLDSALQSLISQYLPARAAAEALADAQVAIGHGISEGTISAEEAVQIMDGLKASQIKASGEAERSATAFETAWERAVERIDDAFAGLWRDIFEGSLDLVGSLRSIAQQIAAETAHALITRPVSQALSGAFGATGQAAGGGAGGLGNLSSLGNMLGGNNIGTGLAGGMTRLGLGTGGGILTQAGTNLINTPNWAFGVGGIGGSMLGSMLFDGQEAAIGSSIGSAAGSAMGGAFLTALGPFGAVAGGLAGGLFGGGLGSMFGDKTDPRAQYIAVPDATPARAFEDQVFAESDAFGLRFGLGGKSHGVEASEYRQTLEGFAAVSDALAGFFGPEVTEEIADRIADVNDQMKGAGLAIDGWDANAAFQHIFSQILDFGAETGDVMAGLLEERLAGMSGTAAEMATAIEAAIVELSMLPAVVANLEALGQRLGETEEEALRAAGAMAQMAGGVGNLTALQEQYYQHFYTDAERAEVAAEQASAAIDAWNESMGFVGDTAIESSAELRAYIESLDLTTQAGQEAYVSALNAAGAFIQLDEALGQTAASASSAAVSVSEMMEAITPEEVQHQEAMAEMIALFGSWGLQLPKTSDALYELIAAGALTERQIAQVAGSFGTLETAWAGIAAAQEAAIAEIEADLVEMIEAARAASAAAIEAINSHYDALIAAERRASEDRIEAIRDEYDDILDDLNDQLGDARDLVSEFEDALRSAEAALADINRALLEGPGELQQDAIRRADEALDQFRETGELPDNLDDIIDDLTSVDPNDYATRAEYEAALRESERLLEELRDAGAEGLSEAERQMELLERQIDEAQETRDALIRAEERATEDLIAALEEQRQAAIAAEQARLEAEIAALEAAAEAQKQAIIDQTAQELLLSEQQNALLERILGTLDGEVPLSDDPAGGDPPEPTDPLLGLTREFIALYASTEAAHTAQWDRLGNNWATLSQRWHDAEMTAHADLRRVVDTSADRTSEQLEAVRHEIQALQFDLQQIRAATQASARSDSERERIIKRWDGEGVPPDRRDYLLDIKTATEAAVP